MDFICHTKRLQNIGLMCSCFLSVMSSYRRSELMRVWWNRCLSGWPFGGNPMLQWVLHPGYQTLRRRLWCCSKSFYRESLIINENYFQSMFDFLNALSKRRHTWALMGPDSNKMLKGEWKWSQYWSLFSSNITIEHI